MKRRNEEIESNSVADSKQGGAKFAKLGLRWSKFAEGAQKKIGEGTFEGTYGAKLGLRWGKGAELAPKKVQKGIFEKRFCSRALWDRTWKPILDPSWHQEGVKRAKLEPRWRQVRAKRG